MTDDERYEHLYHGHGRGAVICQGMTGFFERPMSVGELAARVPAERIGRDIYRMANYAGMAYVIAWDIIAPAIDAAVLAARAESYQKLADIGGSDPYIQAFNTASEHCSRASKHLGEIAHHAHQLRSALMIAEQRITKNLERTGFNPDIDADLQEIRTALLTRPPNI